MIGMLLQQIEQYAASLVARAFQGIDARQIEIGLVESGRHLNAFLEALDGLISTLRDEVQDAQIIQRLGIHRAGLQRALQMLIGFGCITSLRKHHSQAVVRFGILRSNFQRALQNFAGVVPPFLRAIRIAQIVECQQVMRIQPEGFQKARNRFVYVSLARGDDAKIVPCVRQSVRIVRRKFQRAFECLASCSILVLIQIDASDAI